MSALNFKFSGDIDSKNDETIDQESPFAGGFGHTLPIGESGSGKTVLMNLILENLRNKK